MVLTKSKCDRLKPHSTGKVRDIYDLGDTLLVVTTDRISAFDVVLPNGIPHKGLVLTALSAFWFDHFKNLCPNHLITTDLDRMPPEVRPYADQLEGRTMLVKKAKPFPVECVVRGYLTGSGLKDYRVTGAVCGIKLPAGMVESQKLPEPIFTPSTKAEQGHDQNISFEQMSRMVGASAAQRLKDLTLKIYSGATEYAQKKGIILCDTKFEFGQINGEIVWIDEALTPDSSRFWPAEGYQPGKSQPSYDKQFVRDYLESIHWNKKPPAPVLPDEVAEKTSQKYLEAYRQITGKPLL